MRDEGERQFFALVSKGRARHCLRDGAEEAVSQGAALVWVLWSPSKGFGLRLQPPPGGVAMVSVSLLRSPELIPLSSLPLCV